MNKEEFDKEEEKFYNNLMEKYLVSLNTVYGLILAYQSALKGDYEYLREFGIKVSYNEDMRLMIDIPDKLDIQFIEDDKDEEINNLLDTITLIKKLK